MSIFESIKNAIFGHQAAPAGAAIATAAPPIASGASAPDAAATGALTGVAAPAAAVAAPALSAAALQAQLAQLSAQSPQKLNWQTSIVDLMKLVGLDPSFANRKQLAAELGYKGDTADSASMNIWLHKEVMDKLAQSGGAVTAELKA